MSPSVDKHIHKAKKRGEELGILVKEKIYNISERIGFITTIAICSTIVGILAFFLTLIFGTNKGKN